MKYLISVVGPTAAGKTDFALRMAKNFGASVLSVDSRQAFKEMNIGTAKPTDEELDGLDYHFRDDYLPNEEFNVGTFHKRAKLIIENCLKEKFFTIAVGGSGLYLHSLWFGLDEFPEISPEIRKDVREEFSTSGLVGLLKELKEKDPDTFGEIDHGNPARIQRAIEIIRQGGKPLSFFKTGRKDSPNEYEHIKIGLTMDRNKLYSRINKRVDRMVEMGLEEECRGIIQKYGELPLFLQTIGYKEWIPFFKGEYDLKETIRLIKRNSRRFAKRQYTWFRRYDDISWFEYDQLREMESYIFRKMGLE